MGDDVKRDLAWFAAAFFCLGFSVACLLAAALR